METPMRWALVASALLAVCSAGIPVKRQAVYYSAVNPQQHRPYDHRPYDHRPYAYSQAPVFQTSQVRAVPQYEYQPQPQIPYQRVIVYNPNTGSAVYQQLPAAPVAPADVYPVGPGQFLIPLRADGAAQGGSGAAEGGSGSTGGSGGGLLGFGGFNPTDYLTVFQNYWQSLTGTGTNSQTVNKPAEAGGAAGAGPAGAAGAEAPPAASAEGSKRPEMAEAPMPMPMPAAAPAPTAQRFFVLSQPSVIPNPGVNPAAPAPASSGAVSTYLLLRNQGAPVPVYSYAAQPAQAPVAQATLPSGAGPMVLVRTADNKYGLAPASQPGRVLISGEGIRAQDDVQVSGPGSQAIAYQRFLLGRQGQLAPGFYPTLNPSVVHSLADESISVESAGKDASGSGSTEQPASTANSTGADGDVVDSDSEPPVSIAQVKPSAIALAGPGGVAAAAPMGTALVGPGGMALAAPSATAVAGPSAQSAAVVAPSTHTAGHNADAYKKWLSKKKASIASDEAEAPVDPPIVPEYLIQYGPQ